MATVTGLTAARMQEIEAASIVDGSVVDGNLILEKHDGNTIDAGSVIGPVGPQGPQGLSAIPGEVKLWPADTLPALADWGRWVWADGADYPISAHPVAAAHLGTKWNNFGNPPAPNPGAGRFRVPDLRGLVPAGLDAMPGGARANRITRIDSVTIAKILGTEYHVLTLPQMAKHNHGTSPANGAATIGVSGSISGTATGAGAHAHTQYTSYDYVQNTGSAGSNNRVTGMSADLSRAVDMTGPTSPVGDHTHPVGGSFSGSGTLAEQGGDAQHENVQPTVFVPYIVCLDG